jgi:hypothetical protein
VPPVLPFPEGEVLPPPPTVLPLPCSVAFPLELPDPAPAVEKEHCVAIALVAKQKIGVRTLYQ